jgi:hypothetical protein
MAKLTANSVIFGDPNNSVAFPARVGSTGGGTQTQGGNYYMTVYKNTRFRTEWNPGTAAKEFVWSAQAQPAVKYVKITIQAAGGGGGSQCGPATNVNCIVGAAAGGSAGAAAIVGFPTASIPASPLYINLGPASALDFAPPAFSGARAAAVASASYIGGAPFTPNGPHPFGLLILNGGEGGSYQLNAPPAGPVPSFGTNWSWFYHPAPTSSVNPLVSGSTTIIPGQGGELGLWSMRGGNGGSSIFGSGGGGGVSPAWPNSTPFHGGDGRGVTTAWGAGGGGGFLLSPGGPGPSKFIGTGGRGGGSICIIEEFY